MERTIKIHLPEEVEAALEEAASEEGTSQDEVVSQAISDYLFVRKFRLLRERMIDPTAKPYTDQDVFDRVS